MKQQRVWLSIPLMAMVLLVAGADWDKPVRVDDGEVRRGSLSSVNAKITVGDGASVGECESVNGSIAIGEDVNVDRISSVNGGVKIGQGTVVEDGISTVNGGITMGYRTRARYLDTVNGEVRMAGAEIADDVSTINGDIELQEGSRVGGSVIVKDRGPGSDRRKRALRIELDGGSVIEGDLIVEDESTVVEVYLRGGSRVMGRVENARVIDG